MKNLFVFILMILLFGCTPENPTPNPPPNTTYTVKFVAIGNDNFRIFNTTNSTGGLDSYNIQANQEWTREFTASSGQYMSFCSAESSETQFPIDLFVSLKVYLNGVLWKEANGNSVLFIQAYLP